MNLTRNFWWASSTHTWQLFYVTLVMLKTIKRLRSSIIVVKVFLALQTLSRYNIFIKKLSLCLFLRWFLLWKIIVNKTIKKIASLIPGHRIDRRRLVLRYSVPCFYLFRDIACSVAKLNAEFFLIYQLNLL